MRYRYQTLEFGELDIHLRTLRDTNEFEDPTGKGEALGIPAASWPLFGVVWSSSIALAAEMANKDIEGLRILEVGCGIAVPTLVLRHRGADITASDRHPEAKLFLDENLALNQLGPVPFVRADWQNGSEDLGRFDLIIGSDLLYDREQAEPLAAFVQAHATETSEMILVDPGRGQAGQFGRAMEALGYRYEKRRATADDSLELSSEVGPRVQIHTFNKG